VALYVARESEGEGLWGMILEFRGAKKNDKIKTDP
jgi:hypothetical protein